MSTFAASSTASEIDELSVLETVQLSPDSEPLYGRVDRVIFSNGVLSCEIPKLLSTRPTKLVNFELPFSFVMGPDQVQKIKHCKSLNQILAEVICLEPAGVAARVKLVLDGKLDHILLTFTPNHIPVKPASIDGIVELLEFGHHDVGLRFKQIAPVLRKYSGENNFQTRIDLCASHWLAWRAMSDHMWINIHCAACEEVYKTHAEGTHRESVCICGVYSFEQYILEFDLIVNKTDTNTDSNKDSTEPFLATEILNYDSVHFESHKEQQLYLITRKLMYVTMGCNKLYGHDGHTYDANGQRVGEEFYAVNRLLDGDIVKGEFLSQVEGLQVLKCE